MRLAPVAIRYHRDVAEASETAAESSRSTHAATRPVDACRVLGAMTAALIGGAPAAEVLAPEFWSWGALHPEIQSVVRGSWRDKVPPAIRGTGYCVDALEAALWAAGGASDFADAVLRAANLGDDADTTAAIAGQLAGARWGAAGIPPRWRQRLFFEPRIVELAAGLFRAGSGDPPQARWPHDDYVHAWWVEPGRVLAGEYPGDRKPAVAAARVNLLVDAGIRTFVDLTTPEDPLEPYAPIVAAAATNRRLDLRYCNVGIPDFSVSDDATYDRLLDLIRRESGRGGVFVHCWGGIGRTGTVVGCLLAAGGLGYDEIVTRLAALREGTRKSVRPAPEADSQHEVLRRRSG
jgi:predicted protein tyrosine phosphatase